MNRPLPTLSHGTLDDLAAVSPRLSNVLAETEHTTLQLIPSAPYEVGFCAPHDVLSVFCAPHRAVSAYDSDRFQEHTIEAGTLAFHPAKSQCRAASTSIHSDFSALEFTPAYRDQVIEDVGVRPNRLLGGVTFLHGRPQQTVQIAHAIRRFLLSGGAGGQLVAESLATATLVEALLTAHELQVAETKPVSALSHRDIRRVAEYIDAHLCADVGLTELANVIDLTPYHFARSFKRTIGQTPHQFVLERRIALARAKLQFSDLTIADIAYGTGFSSQAHMTDAFKKRLGITPGRYRSDTAPETIGNDGT